jgi:hypothetical protein
VHRDDNDTLAVSSAPSTPSPTPTPTAEDAPLTDAGTDIPPALYQVKAIHRFDTTDGSEISFAVGNVARSVLINVHNVSFLGGQG